jgi:hypothetical protein
LAGAISAVVGVGAGDQQQLEHVGVILFLPLAASRLASGGRVHGIERVGPGAAGQQQPHGF